ncbi:mitochondrial chaperone bcs1 [Cordyceps javanica]|uniref:Mitochondrial chaperone bcs1 n=1 Tax=Cordyceps javanica TaxID=43265 RepID=A0A545VIE6_9HYPO|nr:mitochondrial chaperone bcs1 [Cordyceps javanica]TQW01503.1 mitochondrial chaperone bcs1 [Cordyceps javanica]
MPQLLAWGINSYGPLMLVFGLVAILKSYAYQAQAWFVEYFTTTTSVESTDEMHDMLMAWASSHGLNEAARSRIARVGVTWANEKKDSSDPVKKPISFSPWKGGFLFSFKNHFLYYQTETVVNTLCRKEIVSITCVGRSGDVLRELLEQCRSEYLQNNEGKITIFENRDDSWKKRAAKQIRPLSTVMLAKHQKEALINDVREFVNPETREWYRQKNFAYRRGYLLYGPPGTGKSSLSSAIAGEFEMDIYTINIPSVDDKTLKKLFNQLPDKCVVLLEDIDAVGTDRSTSEEERKERKQSLSLSGLLNEIDGVASQEGRLLIMTTNHKNLLDDALIREGRIDLKIEFSLADSVTTANLFKFMYEPVVGAKPLDSLQAKALARCATSFAALVPEYEFSGAQITSYLLQHRSSPAAALESAGEWVTRILRERADNYRKAPTDMSSKSPLDASPEVPAEIDEEGLRGRSRTRSEPRLRRTETSYNLLPTRGPSPSPLLRLQSDTSLDATDTTPASTGSATSHSAAARRTADFHYSLATSSRETQAGNYKQHDSFTDYSEGSSDGGLFMNPLKARGVPNSAATHKSKKHRFLGWAR